MTRYRLDWAFAHGGPAGSGRIRAACEDFRVDEVPLVEADGEGEHVLLHIEKRGTNTDHVARRLTQLAGVRPVDVSYAGLKDRYAITTQWFSVRLAGGSEPDWSALEDGTVRVLSVARHGRKLRRGALRGNRFRLVVRDLQVDPATLEARLEAVGTRGVPNYFGEQRFGRGAGNLDRAEALFRGKFRERNRQKRGLYLSAARSWLFNRVLGERVALGNWDRALPGDAMMLDGRSSVFPCEVPDPAIWERLEAGEIHPTGPLWGEGKRLVSGASLALEDGVLEGEALFREGLERARLQQERRSLRLAVRELAWDREPGILTLAFRLEPGAYATAVLREILAWHDTPGPA